MTGELKARGPWPLNALRYVLMCVALGAPLSSCSSNKTVVTVPVPASSDSVSSAVVNELQRYYANLGLFADSMRKQRPPLRSPCAPTSVRGPRPTTDACMAYSYSQPEDSVYPRAMLMYTDSLAARLVDMRARVGAHHVLDDALLFAHAWRRSPDALTVPINNCDTVLWWCDALRGMVHHRLGNTVVAEQHFERMFSAMPQKESCVWRMLGLLPRATCAEASPASDSLMWWLADPLWLEPGNDRWTEHLSRHVLFRVFEQHDEMLRRARNSPRQAKSMVDWGRALRLSRAVRSGAYFMGAYSNVDRHLLLRTSVGSWMREVQGPKYEFTPLNPQRFAEVTSSDTSQLAAWPAPASLSIGSCPYLDCLTRPGAGQMQSQSMLTSRGKVYRFNQEGMGVNESYGRHQQFDRIREFQVITLPREHGRRFYAAYPVRRVSEPEPMGVAFSRSPTDSITRLLASDTSGDVVRVTGTLPHDGGVISLEAVANTRQVWRHRFFLPADSTSEVSPVVLLADAESIGTASRDAALPDALPLDRLMPRTWLHATERFVLYWEVLDSTLANNVALEFRKADKSTWQQVTGIFRSGADGQSVRVEPGTLSPMVRNGTRVGFGLPFTLSGLAPGRYEVRAIARDSATGVERSGKATEIELRPQP